MDAPRDPIEDPGSKNGMEPIESVQLPERIRDQYGDEAVDYLEALKEVDLETTAVPETSSHRSHMSDFANSLDWIREMRGDQFAEKLKRRLTAIQLLSPTIDIELSAEELFERLTSLEENEFLRQVHHELCDPGEVKSLAAMVGFPDERIRSGDISWEDLWPYIKGSARRCLVEHRLRNKIGPQVDLVELQNTILRLVQSPNKLIRIGGEVSGKSYEIVNYLWDRKSATKIDIYRDCWDKPIQPASADKAIARCRTELDELNEGVFLSTKNDIVTLERMDE